MTITIKDFEPPANLRPFREHGRFQLWQCWYVVIKNHKIIITNETTSAVE